MKRKLIALLLTTSLAFAPSAAFADEKDDRIAELEALIVTMQETIDDLTSQLEEMKNKNNSTNQDFYSIGEPWIVEGQWSLVVDSVEETQYRNQFSDKNPAAVYIITYTYENLGYEDDFMDGLFISLDEGIVDSAKAMGYSYPGDVTYYADETPVGAICKAQECIAVDNAGDFEIHYSKYDSNDEKQKAVFHLTVNS